MGERPPKKASPQEKKRNSYAKDRRNAYGENDKSSRKSIPARKAGENHDDRRKVSRSLAGFAKLGPEAADLVESSVRHDISRVGGWKKQPDAPLSEHLETRPRNKLSID